MADKGFPAEYLQKDLDDPTAIPYDEIYLFDQSLGYLTDHVSIGTTDVYLGLARNMYENGAFSKTDDDRLKTFAEYKIFDSMGRNIVENIIREGNWQTPIAGFKDENVARHYLGVLPMLKALAVKMHEESELNYGPERHVVEVIAKLVEIQVYFDQRDTDQN